MDPLVQINRKSREMIYGNATVANDRESKKLSIELKNIESQQHRHMVKLHTSKLRMKNALSMPSLLAVGRENSSFLSPPLSPRAPNSLPVSPVTSPRLSRRRHSDVITSSSASLIKDSLRLKKTDNFNKSRSEERLDQQVREFAGVASKGAVSPRILRRSSVHPISSSRSNSTELLDQQIREVAGVAIKGAVSPRILRRSSVHPTSPSQALESSVNTNKVAPQAYRSRRRLSAGCAPLRPIDENRNNLDQRIKKFHESLKVLKGEKVQDVLDEDDRQDSEVVPDLNNNIPKLPEISPNTKRSRSLPSLIPRLSLANLKCELLPGDDHHDDLRRCRYLRISDQDDLEEDDVFTTN